MESTHLRDDTQQGWGTLGAVVKEWGWLLIPWTTETFDWRACHGAVTRRAMESMVSSHYINVWVVYARCMPLRRRRTGSMVAVLRKRFPMKKSMYLILAALVLLLGSAVSSYAASGARGGHGGGGGGWAGHGGGGSSWHGGGGASWHGRGGGSWGWHGGGGSWGGHGGGWQGGWGWHGGWHGGGVVIGIGPGYWGPWWYGPGYPYYPYPYPYYPYPYYGGTAPVIQQGQGYIQQPAPQAQQSPYWYYCQNPQGYYPYVQQCPGGWMTVVPPTTAPPPAQ